MTVETTQKKKHDILYFYLTLQDLGKLPREIDLDQLASLLLILEAFLSSDMKRIV